MVNRSEGPGRDSFTVPLAPLEPLLNRHPSFPVDSEPDLEAGQLHRSDSLGEWLTLLVRNMLDAIVVDDSPHCYRKAD